ncbi:hypothetical protein GWI33_020486 [Rhynchophorus ferrugineus]|uniref:Hexosyltransferase n=1 Tax=Rhynchophorus ferrugineus TaxID=354439 RepID=A0A834M5R8_RHYFE|nr:hypothetical protein GWI33_020486 [Rhynchophorus ferrugineus]
MLLILVSSAPANILKREAIRETWGNSNGNFQVLFLFGRTTDRDLQNQIEAENRLYHDVVQGDFLDTYRNLTLKTVMALEYAIRYWSFKYVLKVDDDVFVNTPQLMFFLKYDLDPKNVTNLLLCMQHKNVKVVRHQSEKFGKYTVSYNEYPYEIYPPYCSGWGVLFTMDTIFKLHDNIASTPFFYLEDVYTYGLVASRIPELQRIDIRPYTLYLNGIQNILRGSNRDAFLVGPYNIEEHHVYQLWEAITKVPLVHMKIAI